MGEEKCKECGEVKKLMGRGMCKRCYQRLWARRKRAREQGKKSLALVKREGKKSDIEEAWAKIINAVNEFCRVMQEENKALEKSNQALEALKKKLRGDLIRVCAEKRKVEERARRLEMYVPEAVQERVENGFCK